MKPRPKHARSRSNASARSLTDRPGSSASARSLTDRRDSSTTPVDRRPSNIMSNRRPSSSIVEEATPRTSQAPNSRPDGYAEGQQDLDITSLQDNALTVDEPSKSPILTARRVSTFDEVHLSESLEVAELNESRGRSITTGANDSDRSHSRSSVSSSRAPINYQTSKLAHTTSSTTAPPSKPVIPSAMSRKLSSPFAWLSRKKTAAPESTSPPHPPTARRHTAAVAGSLGSNPEFMLSRLDEDRVHDGMSSGTRLPARESLKERFKILRMREEAGINLDSPGERRGSVSSRSTTLGRNENAGLGIDTPKNVLEDEDTTMTTSTPPIPEAEVRSERHSSRNNSIASSFDPNLAPGTVSGMSTGPSAMQDPEAPVDWDLWQAVVYEGPAAVAKSSAAELNRAIASGIPSAIRGVVWQVLGQSKNEELEAVYRELVNRGTDKEIQVNSPNLSSGPHSANSLQSSGTQKESMASSASSVRSGSSTPATTNGVTSPTLAQEMDATKLQAAMSAERQKKAKEELATIKKLEKTIRKDLGARTNYSKYAAAAGLQEGLFGVCKAYALFDEGVGYAQGMNFIVMPLLFNVGRSPQLSSRF